MEQEHKQPKRSSSKRSESELRNENLDAGAILLQFESKLNCNQSIVNKWRAVEKKGFLVTVDGCLIPHKQHWQGTRSHNPAHSICSQFFFGKKATTKDTINQYGWPLTEQYSHLCHNSKCASPLCIVVEEQYKNLKRNYCGEFGSCNCCVQPPCRKIYYSPKIEVKEEYLSYSTANLSQKIKDLFGSKVQSVKVLPRDQYFVQDQKRQNRNLRIKRKKQQQKNTKKKAKVKDKSSSSEDDENESESSESSE